MTVQDSSNLEVAELLLDRGADVNAKNDLGQTPLYHADSEVAELLLDHGADVNAKNDFGQTPLHYADSEEAELLLDRGADVNAKDDIGQTPLHRVVEILYVEKQVIQNDDTWTLRYEALENPDQVMVEAAVELLLNRGADAHAKDVNGNTPCQLAREREGFFFDTQFVNRLCSP